MNTKEGNKRVIALGFFDGVHLGHGALLRRVTARAAQLDAIPAALTFARQPRELVTGKKTPLLNTAQDRAELMKTCYGIQEVTALPFDRTMMEMPWDQFIIQVVVGRFHAVHVVVGHDHRFGYRGEGTPERLEGLCRRLGLGCDIVKEVELDGITVSSTYIRGLIEKGDMDRARRFLGHPHVLSGPVVHGKQLGRRLGIPTANLVLPDGILSPAFGVYATKVITADRSYLAVTNVGVRPTVDENGKETVEPWMLDYDGDLYGREIRIEFYTRLRPEKKFSGIEELKAEILRNADQTRVYFARLEAEGQA